MIINSNLRNHHRIWYQQREWTTPVTPPVDPQYFLQQTAVSESAVSSNQHSAVVPYRCVCPAVSAVCCTTDTHRSHILTQLSAVGCFCCLSQKLSSAVMVTAVCLYSSFYFIHQISHHSSLISSRQSLTQCCQESGLRTLRFESGQVWQVELVQASLCCKCCHACQRCPALLVTNSLF